MTLISPKSTMFTLIIQSCIVNMSNTCIKLQMNLNYVCLKTKIKNAKHCSPEWNYHPRSKLIKTVSRI